MKNFVLSLLLILTSCTVIKSQDASKIVKWDAELIELGKVKKGSKVSNVFSFTNISVEDIEIDIVSTCECTMAKWTQGPIGPGKTGKIDFTFDSSKKDDVVPIDVDVYFVNTDPATENPYSVFLQYTFEY